MELFEQNLHIADSAFERMQRDADRVMQKLLKNMVEKGALTAALRLRLIFHLNRILSRIRIHTSRVKPEKCYLLHLRTKLVL